MKKMSNIEKTLKEIVKRVNETLRYYENDYIELKRTAESEKEVCKSFEQYVEIRFNMEASKVTEFADLQKLTGGHLFICRSLKDADGVRRRFSIATIELVSLSEFENSNEGLKRDFDKVKDIIGGTRIRFNSVKKRIKVQIDD